MAGIGPIGISLIIVLVFLVLSLKQLLEYERGVVLDV